MSIFQLGFMGRAYVVGIVLGVIIPCIGVVVVLRRLSMIGDALSHTSLAGVAAGLLIGIHPIAGAVAACILGALSIEIIRKKLGRYAELSIAVVLSAGVGLAGVLSGKLTSSAEFNSFLFGSIVAIDDVELVLVPLIGVGVAAVFLLLYREFFAVSFDERGARLSGVPVRLVNTAFTLLTAVTVSIAAHTVGALMVSSLMVVPVVCSMQVARSYRSTVIGSILFGVLFTILGLQLSLYADLRPGSSIVLTGVGILILLMLATRGFAMLRRRNRKGESA